MTKGTFHRAEAPLTEDQSNLEAGLEMLPLERCESGLVPGIMQGAVGYEANPRNADLASPS